MGTKVCMLVDNFTKGKSFDDFLIDDYGEKVAEAFEPFVHQSKDGTYAIKATSAIASDVDLHELFP